MKHGFLIIIHFLNSEIWSHIAITQEQHLHQKYKGCSFLQVATSKQKQHDSKYQTHNQRILNAIKLSILEKSIDNGESQNLLSFGQLNDIRTNTLNLKPDSEFSKFDIGKNTETIPVTQTQPPYLKELRSILSSNSIQKKTKRVKVIMLYNILCRLLFSFVDFIFVVNC